MIGLNQVFVTIMMLYDYVFETLVLLGVIRSDKSHLVLIDQYMIASVNCLKNRCFQELNLLHLSACVTRRGGDY